MMAMIGLLRLGFPILIALAFSGCLSLTVLRDRAAEISISNSDLGGGIEVDRPVLRILPGEKVVWKNMTTYDLQLNVEPDLKHPSFISPFSTGEASFNTPGTYSYTLLFSSAKTFGRVTGTIVVENPQPDRPPDENQEPEILPPDQMPETEPFII
ncbi:MAG: hypothetical protein WAO55_15695 [Candidatus Manganitrophaceae bacterium]